jgi:rhodanese-related sulfurtransferase
VTAPSLPPDPSIDARGLPVGYAFKPDWEITPRDTLDALNANHAFLLDCRKPDEFAAARIDGSTLFPMAEVPRRFDEIEDAAGGKDRPIIVHCHHGRRSLQVTATLRGLGFTNVLSMAGGIDLWSRTIDPAVPRY